MSQKLIEIKSKYLSLSKKKKAFFFGGFVIVLVALILICIPLGNNTLALKDCKTLKKMMLHPSSFELYDDVYICKFEGRKLVYIEYADSNRYGYPASGCAIFEGTEYIGDFYDDESDFSSQHEYDRFLLDYRLPYSLASATGDFSNFKTVKQSYLMHRLS